MRLEEGKYPVVLVATKVKLASYKMVHAVPVNGGATLIPLSAVRWHGMGASTAVHKK